MTATKHTTRATLSAPDALLTRHRGHPYPFFLDRAGSDEWSFAGSSPVRQLVVDRTGTAHLWSGWNWNVVEAGPLEAIADFVRADYAELFQPLPGLKSATVVPRTVGYLAYELGTFIEDTACVPHDPIHAPLAVLSSYDHVDAWHPRHGKVEHINFSRTASGGRPPPPACPTPEVVPSKTNPRRLYDAGFARIKAAIRTGEIYQANLSRRIALPFHEDPIQAYLRLRERQPVPWGAYVDVGAWKLLSNSPECFLAVAGDCIRTFPIKGTRPRRSDPLLDRTARAELLTDEKERAEHLMIVDLERNDLGRICRIGSIEVPSLASVESFSKVHHLVSEVRGRLRPNVGLSDILRATFPGGSITGAPKIKAMEIIAEVEPTARGIYTGAIGCFNGDHAFALNVAIRTAIAVSGRIHYATGGGIVADSSLEAEYRETEIKSLAFLEAVDALRKTDCTATGDRPCTAF